MQYTHIVKTPGTLQAHHYRTVACTFARPTLNRSHIIIITRTQNAPNNIKRCNINTGRRSRCTGTAGHHQIIIIISSSSERPQQRVQMARLSAALYRTTRTSLYVCCRKYEYQVVFRCALWCLHFNMHTAPLPLSAAETPLLLQPSLLSLRGTERQSGTLY